MADLELAPAAQQWVNSVLIWVGFGTLAGLLARSVLPGKDPAGAMTTIVIGILGSTLGLLVLTQLSRLLFASPPPNPVSPIGIICATGGAFLVFLGYRVLLACMLPEPAEKEKPKQ
jgi:uncharacterized membrane protein YeaQ/YmgE (transglycosylase-associated protein family)